MILKPVETIMSHNLVYLFVFVSEVEFPTKKYLLRFMDKAKHSTPGPWLPGYPSLCSVAKPEPFRWATPGATQMARGGIRLVQGHTKSTLITYFSCMKIDPKYAFLHAFFLICLSCPFQNVYMTKNTPFFFQFCTFLHP